MAPRSYQNKTKSLVFYFYLELLLKLLGFPPERWPDQLYVAVISESPSTIPWTVKNAPKFDGFFNLTMSYRKDSDILYAHFLVEPLKYTAHEQEDKWHRLQVSGKLLLCICQATTNHLHCTARISSMHVQIQFWIHFGFHFNVI